jgi:hypothetical protein
MLLSGRTLIRDGSRPIRGVSTSGEEGWPAPGLWLIVSTDWIEFTRARFTLQIICHSFLAIGCDLSLLLRSPLNGAKGRNFRTRKLAPPGRWSGTQDGHFYGEASQISGWRADVTEGQRLYKDRAGRHVSSTVRVARRKMQTYLGDTIVNVPTPIQCCPTSIQVSPRVPDREKYIQQIVAAMPADKESRCIWCGSWQHLHHADLGGYSQPLRVDLCFGRWGHSR